MQPVRVSHLLPVLLLHEKRPVWDPSEMRRSEPLLSGPLLPCCDWHCETCHARGTVCHDQAAHRCAVKRHTQLHAGLAVRLSPSAGRVS